MKKNIRIIWFLCSVLLLTIFINFTPITLFFKFGTYISIVESFICFSLMAFALLNISSLKDLKNINESPEKIGLTSILISFLSIIILIFVFDHYSKSRIDTKIQNNGILTLAKVINGEQIITRSLRRKSTSYNISISYIDSLTNKKIYSKTDINSDIFSRVYKDQIIQIKYLPKYPSVFKVMIGEENIKKFKITSRYVNFYDIEKLLVLNSINSQFKHLNSLSHGWNKSSNEKGLIFSNELKKEFIIIKSGKIYLESPNLDNFIPKNLIIKKTRFKSENVSVIIDNSMLYETEYLRIIKFDRLILEKSSPKKEKFLLIEEK